VEGSGYGLSLRYFMGICLEWLSKTMRKHIQDSRSLNRDLHPGPPEYEACESNTRLRHSFCVPSV
jgi:hypothetical protein